MEQAAGSVGNVALWIRDGENNSVRLMQTLPKSLLESKTKRYGRLQYVKMSDTDILTKKGVIIGSPRGFADLQFQTLSQCTPHVVAVPMNSAVTAKMSPYKPEPSILPKPVHIASSPMILSTPQRVVSLSSSPRTPHSLLSPAVDGSASWTSKRGHDFSESENSDGGKRCKKSSEKGGKGLRHFSMKVCEKVQKKGVTSYNEVADELVAEFSDPQRSMSPTDQAYDQKNIRRRVYDALNVLMAMNIISKEKKEIRWLGLPTNSAQECQNLEQEKLKRLERIRVKTQQLHELILQQIAFKTLVQRNKQLENENGIPTANSTIHLPFIIVNTSRKTVIDCSISNDKMEYLFNFDNTFEIHDDIEVLKRMGMTCGLEKGECSTSDLDNVKRMVPKSLENYVNQMSLGATSFSSSTSIVAGPSGIRTGIPSGAQDSSGSDSRMQDRPEFTLNVDSQDIPDVEMVNMEANGGRRLSRQSSVASDNLLTRLEPATTTDEEFSESESEVEDDDSIVDVN